MHTAAIASTPCPVFPNPEYGDSSLSKMHTAAITSTPGPVFYPGIWIFDWGSDPDDNTTPTSATPSVLYLYVVRVLRRRETSSQHDSSLSKMHTAAITPIITSWLDQLAISSSVLYLY